MLLAERPAHQLVAVLGHELRNPLAAAMVQVSLARDLTEPGDPRATQLAAALGELQRAGDLLGAYLALGTGRLPPGEPIDLALLAQELRERTPQLRVSNHGQTARVHGSRCLLRRCLENLIENSLRAGATRIVIELILDGEDVAVVVRDDGSGIAAEQRASLFRPFDSHSGGSGIGLALVRAIAELHGGSIELMDSRQGAAFQLRLPRAAA